MKFQIFTYNTALAGNSNRWVSKTIDKSKTSANRAPTCDWIELALRFQFGKKGETRNLNLSISPIWARELNFFLQICILNRLKNHIKWLKVAKEFLTQVQ